MQTGETVIKRRSVREFQDRDISKDTLARLVDAGRLAATARNEQPWEFVVVTDKEKKDKIAGITTPNGGFIRQAAAVIVVFCREGKYYLEDGCAATENILLMAADLGIGSCWVAGDKKPYCPDLAKLLKAPPEYRLVSLIALGYPKDEPKAISKRKLEEVLHWQVF